MNNKSLSNQPSTALGAMVESWWANLWQAEHVAGTSFRRERDTITTLQWLVVICISYLVFAIEDWNLRDPVAGLLISTCLLSAVILPRLPERIFRKPFLAPGLVVLDSLLIVSAMIMRQQTPWDLLLLLFFCVFIAAIGENLIQVGIGSVLLSVAFLLFFSPNAQDASTVSPDLMIRVPFMFGISIFFGYMTSRVREEKRRMERVEAVVSARRQFVCALVHDMKTPLNVIGGYAELLAGKFGGQEDPTERESYLERIRENIDRVLKLVTDFLTVSKLETVGLEAARNLVQVNAIAEDVALQQMVSAREKSITLTLDVDRNLKPVLGDSSQLQRALSNLVGNAVKFTGADGTIGLRSHMMGKNVCIEVADTGPGISQDEIPRLFSEFERLKGSANTEGTGLGLFIVKTIVEAHHGTVEVESEVGVGTTFKIIIPATEAISDPTDVGQRNEESETQDLNAHAHSQNDYLLHTR